MIIYGLLLIILLFIGFADGDPLYFVAAGGGLLSLPY